MRTRAITVTLLATTVGAMFGLTATVTYVMYSLLNSIY